MFFVSFFKSFYAFKLRYGNNYLGVLKLLIS